MLNTTLGWRFNVIFDYYVQASLSTHQNGYSGVGDSGIGDLGVRDSSNIPTVAHAITNFHYSCSSVKETEFFDKPNVA